MKGGDVLCLEVWDMVGVVALSGGALVAALVGVLVGVVVARFVVSGSVRGFS